MKVSQLRLTETQMPVFELLRESQEWKSSSELGVSLNTVRAMKAKGALKSRGIKSPEGIESPQTGVFWHSTFAKKVR